MKELALHILDIAENSISAQATNICIRVNENKHLDKLNIQIIDDGKGMDAETLIKVTDPFTTSRTTRKVGLGIPLIKAAAEDCNGFFTINSAPNQGARVEIEFQNSHIDRMPLGDISGTILSLVIGSPEIHWIFEYTVNNNCFVFDDEMIKKELEGIPLSEPSVIKFLREYIKEGICSVLQDQSTTE